jgi:exopolysaccharide biosynthesis WecB/TagA/CpsF family protein
MDTLKIPLLGLEFDNVTLPEAAQRLLARPPSAHFAYVVTPNADHLVRLRRDPPLRLIYRGAMLCLLDSRFIAHLARPLGLPCPEVITGADLTEALLAQMQGTAAVIGLDARGVAALAARYPRVVFLHHQPPPGLLRNQAAFAVARDFAVDTKADFTFLALGSPLQERLAYSIAQDPRAAGVGLCTGAALEFCAGIRPRAPGWMRRAGLEWLYRLAREPRRLAPRYLVRDPEIFVALLTSALRKRSLF